MKKIMLILTIITIAAVAFTGCSQTTRGNKLSPEQAAIVSKSLNGITLNATATANKDFTNARASKSETKTFGSGSTLDTSDIIITTKNTATCSLLAASVSSESIITFKGYEFDTRINVDDDPDLENVHITLKGNYRVFFEAKGNIASGGSIKFEIGEYANKEYNGLQMSLKGDDFKPFETWINFNIKFLAKISTVTGDTDLTITGSINGNKVTKDNLDDFNYNYFKK